MKKTILLIGALLIGFLNYAQSYEVTPEGLKDQDNNDNNYLVLRASYKNADELFKNAMEFVKHNFKHPENAIIKKEPGKLLLIKNTAPQFIQVKSGVMLDISAEYEIELRFKDNKVRYEVKNLKMKADDSNRGVLFNDKERRTFAYHIFKGDNVNLPKTKKDIEKYFNDEAHEIEHFLQGKGSTDDDW